MSFFTIVGVWYLYPEPKNEPYSSTTQYNLGIMKTFLIQDNLDSNLSLFVESSMSCHSADRSLCRICWRYLKKADSSAASESAVFDLHAIDPLLTWFWELLSL